MQVVAGRLRINSWTIKVGGADLSPDQIFALITGDYQTGAQEGARALKISQEGRVHWLHLGPGGTIAEDTEVATQPVPSHGKPALLADERALSEVADAASLVFYNETYRRKAP